MSEPISTEEAIEACECKVGESAWRYDIMDMIAQVGTEWRTSPTRGGPSSKDLARRFNRALIEAAAEEHGVRLIDGEAENYRRILAGEGDVDSGMKVDAKAKLTERGIDADGLNGALIGETTMHKHLVNCLGLEYHEPRPTVEESVDRVSRAKKQCRENVKRALGRQGIEDEVSRVGVSVTATCADCGEVYDASELIEKSGCDCG